MAAFEQDEVLTTALGRPLATTLLAIRRAEWSAMKDFTLAEEVALLLERY
jgi:glutamine synthetase